MFDDEVGEWYSLEKLVGEGAGGELSAGEEKRRLSAGEENSQQERGRGELLLLLSLVSEKHDQSPNTALSTTLK